jgi:hypothetical protein
VSPRQTDGLCESHLRSASALSHLAVAQYPHPPLSSSRVHQARRGHDLVVAKSKHPPRTRSWPTSFTALLTSSSHHHLPGQGSPAVHACACALGLGPTWVNCRAGPMRLEGVSFGRAVLCTRLQLLAPVNRDRGAPIVPTRRNFRLDKKSIRARGVPVFFASHHRE